MARKGEREIFIINFRYGGEDAPRVGYRCLSRFIRAITFSRQPTLGYEGKPQLLIIRCIIFFAVVSLCRFLLKIDQLASQPALRPLLLASGPSQLALRPSQLALRPSWLALKSSQLIDCQDRQTDRRTDGRKISPFYRTSSPTRAAALLPNGQ